MKNLDQKKLDIVIVNYNGGELILDCLRSIEQAKNEANIQIFVVDNASSDNSVSEIKRLYPKVNLLQSSTNLGFAKANNLALKKLTSEYILILNPDVKVLPGTLKYMLQFMEGNIDVGAASCKVELTSGKLDWASHRGFPTPWASFLYFIFKNDSLYHLTNKDMDKAHEVDGIAGAFFLTRKSVLEKVGLFDEDYFMYAEDLDLCYRIKKAGDEQGSSHAKHNYKIMYVPEVKIIHYKGATSGIKSHSQDISTASVESRKKAFNAFYEAMIIFYKKHLAQNYPFFINWLVILGINLKWKLAKRKMTV